MWQRAASIEASSCMARKRQQRMSWRKRRMWQLGEAMAYGVSVSNHHRVTAENIGIGMAKRRNIEINK